MEPVLKSVITCAACGFGKEETMPSDSCRILYKCVKCGKLLRPKQGDCCVFCSYGSVPCPPVQRERADPTRLQRGGNRGMRCRSVPRED